MIPAAIPTTRKMIRRSANKPHATIIAVDIVLMSMDSPPTLTLGAAGHCLLAPAKCTTRLSVALFPPIVRDARRKISANEFPTYCWAGNSDISACVLCMMLAGGHHDRFRQNYHHDQGVPGKIWAALTKPDVIKTYFFGATVKADWKPGSPIAWTGKCKLRNIRSAD